MRPERAVRSSPNANCEPLLQRYVTCTCGEFALTRARGESHSGGIRIRTGRTGCKRRKCAAPFTPVVRRMRVPSRNRFTALLHNQCARDRVIFRVSLGGWGENPLSDTHTHTHVRTRTNAAIAIVVFCAAASPSSGPDRLTPGLCVCLSVCVRVQVRVRVRVCARLCAKRNIKQTAVHGQKPAPPVRLINPLARGKSGGFPASLYRPNFPLLVLSQ